MRHLVLVLALVLAGCVGTGPGPKPAPVNSVAEAIRAVQKYTSQACKFLPYVETIRAIFGKNKSLDSVSEVGAAICNAVVTNPMSEGPGKRAEFGRVAGVRVKGQRL